MPGLAGALGPRRKVTMMFQMKRNVETKANGADRRDLIKRLQLS